MKRYKDYHKMPYNFQMKAKSDRKLRINEDLQIVIYIFHSYDLKLYINSEHRDLGYMLREFTNEFMEKGK